MEDPNIFDNAEGTRLHASCYIALASLLRDLSTFAERAGLEVSSATLEKLPAVDETTATALLRITVDDFSTSIVTHPHRPETYLQWLIATADLLAAGFEHRKLEKDNVVPDERSPAQKNPYTLRLSTLFEQIQLDDTPTFPALHYRYRLEPLSPATLFPVPANFQEPDDEIAACQEYARLWMAFETALADIPTAHQDALPLWLDHFETLWACYAAGIPSIDAFTIEPDVSLYDHSKVVAALAVALWRYHHDRNDDPEIIRNALAEGSDWDERKFLLVQGDCLGIQDFIFATGGETQKRAAKLLRGRSFHVSLLSECAALRVLETLDLPGTSEIVNAAGKFLIVAPNTSETVEKLIGVQKVLDHWFLKQTWGQSGIGLAWEPACCNDFQRRSSGRQPFAELIARLLQKQEKIRLGRFDLCGTPPPDPLFKDYLKQFGPLGECKIDGRSPATQIIDSNVGVCMLAADQIAIGQYLTNRSRILITKDSTPLRDGMKVLTTRIFDYSIQFADDPGASGWFGPEARNGNLRRCWDISMPETLEQPLWNGCARRTINGYIPRFAEENAWDSDKYVRIRNEILFDRRRGEPKTLNHLACEDRRPDGRKRWIGVDALMTLKGDVDNLGAIFQHGLHEPTIGYLTTLSRQLHAFFAVYLPALCQSEDGFHNTYTVFAGGDDFFLLGPWRSQMQLAERMRNEFARYVAGNPAITFSAGLAMTKPGLPIRVMGKLAEDALERAKDHVLDPTRAPEPKNAICCFGQTVGWSTFSSLLQSRDEIERLASQLELSTGYLYSLLYLSNMAENLLSGRTDRRGQRAINPENALWHSRFAYRTRRLLEQQKDMDEAARRRWQQEIAAIVARGGIERFAGAYQIALLAFLYQRRS